MSWINAENVLPDLEIEHSVIIWNLLKQAPEVLRSCDVLVGFWILWNFNGSFWFGPVWKWNHSDSDFRIVVPNWMARTTYVREYWSCAKFSTFVSTARTNLTEFATIKTVTVFTIVHFIHLLCLSTGHRTLHWHASK